ncbi:elastase-1-like [Clupea harengus]|uniref:Elastase-1-like n=1 Tax=Clupea harengus TaxID=7950 RepID=A0A8M1KKK8_CLUHA|nr:elastase-1-like [Clupea harengus]
MATQELLKTMDVTLNGALAKSEDIATDSPAEKQEEEVADALGDDDEEAEDDDDDDAAAADTPEPAGFDEEVTDALAEDDTAEVDELQGEDSEALDGGDDDDAEKEETPADTPAPAELEEALGKALTSGLVETKPSADSKTSIEKRVVGGSVSSSSLWTWQISLQVRSGSRSRHICGGFLVKRNWVMTAAHCVDSLKTYRVVAGERDLNKQSRREQSLGVSGIYLHPGWRKGLASGNDIALLRLSSFATLNRYVRLAILPRANRVLRHGNRCWVSGWGLTSTRGRISNLLKYAYLPIVSHRVCRRRSWWGSTVKSSMVCAGGDGRRSGCQGDSGGPLNCIVGRRWVVHGVTSFGSSRGCNIRRKPTVFTRVSAHMRWIRSVIGA